MLRVFNGWKQEQSISTEQSRGLQSAVRGFTFNYWETFYRLYCHACHSFFSSSFPSRPSSLSFPVGFFLHQQPYYCPVHCLIHRLALYWHKAKKIWHSCQRILEVSYPMTNIFAHHLWCVSITFPVRDIRCSDIQSIVCNHLSHKDLRHWYRHGALWPIRSANMSLMHSYGPLALLMKWVSS